MRIMMRLPNRRPSPAATALAFVGLLLATAVAQAQSAFYTASDQELAGAPGTIIRAQPMRRAPDGAIAYRVLYRSTSLQDQPIAVSGVVVLPAGPVPAGGRPIVAWAHPTTGVVPHCAPSLAMNPFKHIQGLDAMLARGYAVAATDYSGPGTPGPHPYLVGVSEARAVIDSVRHARPRRSECRSSLCRLGPFAGRTRRTLHRHPDKELRAGARACRRRRGRTPQPSSPP
jgi:Secretory lipase